MTPIIFGEVLFDEFPDGAQILGGAPFNVAWHLRAFNLDPVIISRVGGDELGKKIRQTMQNWQMNIEGLQVDSDHNTGRVIISQTATSHSFEIPANQAFDFINQQELPNNIKHSELLYFGSLCLRNKTSRSALKSLLSLPLKHFVDINLRSPWWDDKVLSLILEQAHWVKLNDEELQVLNGSTTSLESSIKRFFQRHPMDNLIVTCGEKGAYFYDGNELIHDKAPQVTNIKDTVGAGDAFSAVLLFGIYQNWPTNIILKRALAFSADICRIQGATINDISFYQQHTTNWIN